jgi:hypothetical protein
MNTKITFLLLFTVALSVQAQDYGRGWYREGSNQYIWKAQTTPFEQFECLYQLPLKAHPDVLIVLNQDNTVTVISLKNQRGVTRTLTVSFEDYCEFAGPFNVQGTFLGLLYPFLFPIKH